VVAEQRRRTLPRARPRPVEDLPRRDLMRISLLKVSKRHSLQPSLVYAHLVREGKKYFGSVGDTATLNIAANANILKAEFGALTPENSLSKSAPSMYQ
jgi:hypothetical protein